MKEEGFRKNIGKLSDSARVFFKRFSSANHDVLFLIDFEVLTISHYEDTIFEKILSRESKVHLSKHEKKRLNNLLEESPRFMPAMSKLKSATKKTSKSLYNKILKSIAIESVFILKELVKIENSTIAIISTDRSKKFIDDFLNVFLQNQHDINLSVLPKEIATDLTRTNDQIKDQKNNMIEAIINESQHKVIFIFSCENNTDFEPGPVDGYSIVSDVNQVNRYNMITKKSLLHTPKKIIYHQIDHSLTFRDAIERYFKNIALVDDEKLEQIADAIATTQPHP